MEYRRLGRSDTFVSAIATGCWTIGDSRFWGAPDASQSIATLRAAIENGVNFLIPLTGKFRSAEEVTTERARTRHFLPHEGWHVMASAVLRAIHLKL